MSTGPNDPHKCPHCGMFHTTTCLTIKAIEYHQDGSVKRVEFKTANDYPPMVTTSLPTHL